MMRVIAVLAALCVSVATAGAQTVGVGTMSQGTLSFSTGSVIAKVMDEAMGLEARVQPNSGETTLIPLVDAGNLDFGIANSVEAANASQGLAAFKGRPMENLRVATALYPLRVAMFVREDSDAHTLQDLAGKRVTWGFSAMGSIDTVLGAVFANADMTVDDFRPVLVPNVVVGADQFVNGRADAFFFAVGAAKPLEVNASIPLRVIPLDTSEAAVARMQAVFPDGYVAVVPPLPQFAGVSEPTPVLAYDNLLLTNASVPDETITTVLDGLANNKDALVAGFPLFRGLNKENFYKPAITTPYHPATVSWAEAQ